MTDSDVVERIFHYTLSQEIEFFNNIQNSFTITFETSEKTVKEKLCKFIVGFKISCNIKDEIKAKSQTNMIADNLKNLIIIKSGMPVTIFLKVQTNILKSGKQQVIGSFKLSHSMVGGINKLNLNDRQIQKISNANMQKQLKYQYFAIGIIHYYYGYYIDCIRELFKLIETRKKFPKHERYKVIRDIFSHNPYAHYPSTIQNFQNQFNNVLEYKIIKKQPKKIGRTVCNKKIIINHGLIKNEKVFAEIAKEFIQELRRKYKLNK